MNFKDKKGSIAIFVLVGLLFMSAFLIISFASNVNKSKTAKEQFDIVSQIYSYGEGYEGAYDKSYTDLRNKNKQTMNASSEGLENTGTLELTKTFDENISNYRIYGNSVQDGTPSPSNSAETKSVGDKTVNLVEYPYYNSSKTVNGITFTDNGDGTVTVNGTATGQATFDIARSMKELWDGVVPGETYTASLECTGECTGSITFVTNYYKDTATSSSSYSSWISVAPGKTKTSAAPSDIGGLRSYIVFLKGATANNLILKPQLELGSTATEYGPCGKYKIAIKVTGKNQYFNSTNRDADSSYGVNIKNKLGDSSFTVTGTANTNGNLLGAIGNKLEAGNYKIKVEGDNKLNSYYLQLSTDNSTWTNKLLQLQTNNIYSFDVSELSYVRIGIKIVKDEEYTSNYKVLIREADANVSDEYETYKGEVYNIYLDQPLRKAGSVADYIDFKTGKIVRNVDSNSYNALETPIEEVVVLPNLKTLEDYTKIEVLTEIEPSKIEVEYQGYTLE